eukprot:132600_1
MTSLGRATQAHLNQMRVLRTTRETKLKLVTRAAVGSIPGSLHVSGRSRFYPGVIARVHHNGACDIDYDDGEKERMVKDDLIRMRDASSLEPNKSTTYNEGDKIEARYKGRSRFYPGVIARVHHNGACDIDYDDGEKERMVKDDLIRKSDASSFESNESATYNEGDKI